MDYNNLCYRCFAEKPRRDMPCPYCGSTDVRQLSVQCLPVGTLLHNRYIVGVALGVGGFGITYKCLDTKIGGVCALKEYFPNTFAHRKPDMRTIEPHANMSERFTKLMNRFVEEADLLRSFHHKNIVKVYDCFMANGTSYYAMEYCSGIDLRRYAEDFKRHLTYEEGMNIINQVMDGLEYIHDRHMLHRDIAPDNIYITKTNVIKILDFGSTRYEMDQLNRQFSIIIKAGYSPIEQYSGRLKQGPYTDIYAFGATMYHLFTGVTPVESTQRDINNDGMVRFSALRPDLPEALRVCIEKMLVITVSGRVQNIKEMRQILAPLIKSQSVTVQSKTPAPSPVPQQSYSMQRATVSKRLCAYCLDCIIYGLLYSLAVILFVKDTELALWVWLMFPVLLTIINIFTELAAGVTPGKAIMGLSVKSRTGQIAPAVHIMLRNFIKLFGVLSLFFCKNGELPEDRATNSVVLYGR